ncbi:MAG: trigger factor [Planctomycetota bacterium]
MDVTVTESGPCRRTLNIVVPPEKIRAHIEDLYTEASHQVEFKGFRKGKVPKSIIKKRLGDEIIAQAKSSLIERCFRDAIQEHELRPMGEAELDGVGEEALSDSKPLEFQVHVDVRPTFELGSVRGVEIPKGQTDVTDEDVEGALQRFADEKRTLQTVDEPVADGDFVGAELRFKGAEGEVVLEKSDVRLNTGIPIAGTDPQTFADALRGSESGQDRQLEITFPDTFEKEEVRGQTGTVEMSIKAVSRVTPAPIDDELAKGVGADSLEELKETLHKRIGEEKERLELRRQEEEIFNVLLMENRFDLPQSMVEHQAKASLEEFRRRLAQNNVPEEEIEKRLEESQTEAQEDAERRVRLYFLVEAIADKEKIFVTEGDVDVELRNIASHNDVPVDQVRAYYDENRQLPELRLALKERKVREHLRENAKLTD